VLDDVPLPRRTALVPPLGDDGLDDVEPPRDDEPLDDEPLDEDEPALEPDDEDPDDDDPLEGGAERTGCCSEYEGGV
jgi:hypothetical protein